MHGAPSFSSHRWSCLSASAGNAFAAVDEQDTQKGAGTPGLGQYEGARTAVLIEPALTINTTRTAVLIMDYQNDIVSMLPEKMQAPLLDRAGAILKKARQAHLPIVYVVVRFRDGYPEVDPHNKLFSNLKASGRLREGTSGARSMPGSRLNPEISWSRSAVSGLFPPLIWKRSCGQKTSTRSYCSASRRAAWSSSTVRWAADTGLLPRGRVRCLRGPGCGSEPHLVGQGFPPAGYGRDHPGIDQRSPGERSKVMIVQGHERTVRKWIFNI